MLCITRRLPIKSPFYTRVWTEPSNKELAWELSQFAAKNLDVHEVYRNKVLDLLTRGLKTKM